MRRAAPATTAAVLAGLLLTAAPAEAGLLDGVFVQAYTGLGLTEDSLLRLRRPDRGFGLMVTGVSWEDHSLERPSIPYIGFRAGRWLQSRPWLGLAIDVVHYKVFAETERLVRVDGTLEGAEIAGLVRMDALVQQYDVANGVNLWLLAAMVRRRLGRSAEHPDGRLRPYAGFGLGPTLLYTHSTVLGRTRSGYELGRLGAEILAGVEWQLGRRFSLLVEAKRTRTEANGSIQGGDSETRLDSNHLVVGVGYRFGARR